MSASRSISAGGISGSSRTERASRAAFSMPVPRSVPRTVSGCMNACLGVVEAGPVRGQDPGSFRLVLRGEQVVVDAERLIGDDDPADPLVPAERGVGQGELGADGV